MNKKNFYKLFSQITNFSKNSYHPLVCINGKPKLGRNIYIGAMSEINAKGGKVKIGDNCDIASFVSINCADSHKRCVGVSKKIQIKNIIIEHNVFVGSHSFIKGGTHIGHHCVVAAGTIVDPQKIPPYSLIYGNPMKVKKNYYRRKK
tara:strand:+ start:23 stop:463 length:441 start_codon:yes stop_codon:yes gene_type:complete